MNDEKIEARKLNPRNNVALVSILRMSEEREKARKLNRRDNVAFLRMNEEKKKIEHWKI